MRLISQLNSRSLSRARQYRPAIQPESIRSREQFIGRVAEGLSDMRDDNPASALAVFGVLERHIGAAEIAKIQRSLPEEIRSFWPHVFESQAQQEV